MNGETGEQDWDAYPPGGYPPPQSAYGPPPGHGGPPPGYGPGYGPPPGYGPGYGPPPGYGPGYGPPPAYGPAYGPPPGYGPAYGQVAPWNVPGVASTWPYGPDRPGVATAAIALGFVTGGLTALGSLGFLFAVASGEDDPATSLLLLGLPCAIGMIVGSAQLVRRSPPAVLFGSAVAAVAVLVLALVAGAVTLSGDDLAGLSFFAFFAVVLPVVTAVFARLPRVRGWTAAR